MPNRPVAVVAGGSAGVGRAVAERLAREGYDVAILARGEERVRRAADELSALGVDAVGIVCDVGDDAAVRAATDRIVSCFGRIDVWVNSAMLTVVSPFAKVEPGEFEAVMRTTLMGTVNGTRAALSVMRAQGPSGRGNIVNVGSALAYRSIPLQTPYCAAKHAVNGFTQGLRSELIHEGCDGIHLSLVQLPGINTPQFDWARSKIDEHPRPAPPVYQPEVAADGVWKAIATNAREIIVGRAAAKLILGNMVAPAALDRTLASQGYEAQKGQRVNGPQAGNLDRPASGDWGAHGTFGDEAATRGMAVDGDRARALVFGGGALALLGLGALLGKAFAKPTRRAVKRFAAKRGRALVHRRETDHTRDGRHESIGYEAGNEVKGLD